MLFVFDCILDQYKTQDMSDAVVSNDFHAMVYCPDKYRTHEMCDEAVYEDPFLTAYSPDKYITKKKLLIIL